MAENKYLERFFSYLLCQPMKMKLTGHMFPVAENCCWHVTGPYLKSTCHSPYILVYSDHLLTWLLVSLPSILTLTVFVPTLILNHGYTKRGKLYNHQKTFQKARKRKTLLKDHQGFEQNTTSFWFRKGKTLKS